MKKIVISNGPLETKKLATLFKANLQKGDVVLLKGEIGAGKSHFARSLIQSAMYIKEEVPSPTFTLVQVYDTTIGSIWHADLYRLNDYSDVIEHVNCSMDEKSFSEHAPMETTLYLGTLDLDKYSRFMKIGIK